MNETFKTIKTIKRNYGLGFIEEKECLNQILETVVAKLKTL